jgi:tRNA U34 5-carboxymethylaminomethyl modifying GTPase MnmE/TrmE
MRTETDDQELTLENREKYEALKAELLQEYKSTATDLEYADDEFEEDIINQKREKLASKIKELSAKLREIKTLEA